MLRAFYSFRFPLAVLLFTLSRIAVAMQEILEFGRDVRPNSGLLGFSMYFLHSNVSIISTAICCFPFVVAYLEDKESKFSYYMQVRSSMRHYIRSKVITSFVSAQATAFIGYALTTLFFGFYFKFNKGYLLGASSDALSILSENSPTLYFLLFFVHNSAIQGIWALMALCISAFVQNMYLTLALSYTANILIFYLSQLGLTWEILFAGTYNGAYFAFSDTVWQGVLMNLLHISLTCIVLYQIFKMKCFWDWKEA